MSDRARSSVRTGTRSGSGTADGVPEAAGPVDDAAEAPSASAGRPAADPPVTDRAADAPPAEAAPSGATAAGAGKPAPAKAAPVAAAPAKAAAAPAKATAAPAKAAEAPAAPPATPAPPAAHPVTPLVPPGGGRPADDGARPVSSPSPPVPPSTGVNRAATSRSGVPAGALPVDSTQAVSLPPAGARPVDPASRPSAARPEGRSRAEAAPAGSGGKVRGRGPRRARLQLRHIDTFSALKISLVVSIALFCVWMIAIAVLYGVLGGLGVFDTLNDLIGQLSSASGDTATNGGGDVIHASIVFAGAAVIGAVNIVLLTALCTVAAFVYNLMADLVGGLEVTLAERE